MQARMSSSRYPGKVLKPILDKPMIWHQWERTKRATSIDKLILATSTDSSDDVLAAYFTTRKESVFRGSLQNVLSRYYECAVLHQPTHVIRLTADCPLTDPGVIDDVVKTHLKQNNDYTSNQLYPVGISVEVMRFEVLQAAYQEAALRSQREHVTLYIYQHPERFKIGRVDSCDDLSHLRWTVDYAEDFEFVSRVYEALYPEHPHFDMQAILQLLKRQPELIQLNSHFQRNAGLIKSLENDGLMLASDT